MRMKQREDAKHERRNGLSSQSFPIIAALRIADFRRVWLPKPAAADRPGKIHRVVAVSLSVDRGGNWMGDVSVLTLKEPYFRVPQRASHPNTPRERINLLEVAQLGPFWRS